MEVGTLDQTHPSYDGERLADLNALHQGGPAFHARLPRFLPQQPGEPKGLYDKRKALATYPNHIGSIVSLLAALLFSEAPSLTGAASNNYWSNLWADADGCGTPWARWWREGVERAQVVKRFWIWVNRPASSGAANLGEQDRRGELDAWVVPLDGAQVRDWSFGADGQLDWILFRTIEATRSGPDVSRSRQWVWTAIDRENIRRWRWAPDVGSPKTTPDPRDNAVEDAPIPHGLDEVPVVLFELPTGLWTAGKSEDATIAALRAWCNHDWALTRSANELLILQTKDKVPAPTTGQAYYLRLNVSKDVREDAKYIGPSGVALQHLGQHVQSTREEVYRLVHQMAMSADSNASMARLSGESKAQDWRALEIVLASFQDLVLSAMTQTVRLIAKMRGDRDPQMTVTGLEGWQTENLDAWLEMLNKAPHLRERSPTLAREADLEIARRLLRGRVSEDAMKTIETELSAENTPTEE